MAFVDQKKKAAIAPAMKALCKQYNIKASLAVRNNLSLVLNIKSGSIDFIGNGNETCSKNFHQFESNYKPNLKGYEQVNTYHFGEHYSGKAKEFLTKAIALLNMNNHDNSDIMTDYFDVGHYIDVNIGQWNKPYIVA